MEGEKFIRTKLSRLDKRSNPELIRVELFSCVTYLLLSRKYFKKNNDIYNFNRSIKVDLKDYVYKSRTLLIARVNREIEMADKDKLYLILNQVKKVVFNDVSLSNTKKGSQDNKMNLIDDLIEQFPRGNEG